MTTQLKEKILSNLPFIFLLIFLSCSKQEYKFKPGDLVYNYKTGYTYLITGIEPRKRGFFADRNNCFYRAVNAVDSTYKVRWLPQHSIVPSK